jgi:hypothetical protein
VAIPAEIRAGDTVSWVEPATVDQVGDPLTSATWTLTTFLRTNTASEGVTVTGVARADGGWDNTIAAATSVGMDAGQWYWQTRATDGTSTLTLGSGSFTVLASLAYQGTPTAFDGRSQAQQDLDAVQATIRAIISGRSKYYQIGSRQYTSLDLPALMEREAQLKAVVNREKVAEKIVAGLGNPQNMFVRFS